MRYVNSRSNHSWGDQMMKAQLKAGKTLGLKEMIAQGYQAQDLERTDSSRL